MRRASILVCLAAILVLTAAPAFAQGSCAAIQFCRSGATVECSGASSCLVGSTFVECDGNRASCTSSGCSAGYRCPEPPYSLSWAIGCSTSVFGADCVVDHDQNAVRCGHDYRTCDDCEWAYQTPGAPQCLAYP